MKNKLRNIVRHVLSNNWATLSKIEYEFLFKDGIWRKTARDGFWRIERIFGGYFGKPFSCTNPRTNQEKQEQPKKSQ